MNSSLVWNKNKTWFYLCSANVTSEHEEGIKTSIQNTFVIYCPQNSYHMNHHEKKSKELSLQVLPKCHKVVIQMLSMISLLPVLLLEYNEYSKK